MLSWSLIVQRIKEELSLPFQTLEKSDMEIIDYLKRNALRKFTYYFPQKWRMTLDTNDPTYSVPGRSDEYYLIEPDDREIKTIVALYPTAGRDMISGHPFMGAWSAGELPEWHLQLYNSNLISPFGNFDYTHEFIPPNQLRITPHMGGRCTVEYERSHDLELSSINPEMEDLFIDLCQGMFFMMIGKLRQKYSTTSTPFGEIQLNGDLVMSEGKEIYDRTMEKFDRMTIPNIVFDHG
jgi:hypothetical protein